MKLHIENRGTPLHCSPINLPPSSSILEVKKMIGAEVCEDPRDIELKRKDGTLLEDDTLELGVDGIQLRDGDTLHVALPLAHLGTKEPEWHHRTSTSIEFGTEIQKIDKPDDVDELAGSVTSLNIQVVPENNMEAGMTLGDEIVDDSPMMQRKSTFQRTTTNLGHTTERANAENKIQLEQSFEYISCEPGQSKLFLDNTAKIECSEKHGGCHFKARLTPRETFDDIVAEMQDQDWMICSPMLEVDNLAQLRKTQPFCTFSLRHFLFLPKTSHIKKDNEGDEHFLVRISEDTGSKGKWRLSKIESSQINEHSVSWTLNECCHWCVCGLLNFCHHPFHMSIYFLRPKSDASKRKCEQHEVNIHVVARHVDKSYNKEEWDNPKSIEDEFKEKMFVQEGYEEAAKTVDITIPGGGKFFLDVGNQEGLQELRDSLSQQNFSEERKIGMFEKCGTVSLASLSRENGSQCLVNMQNLFPYYQCHDSRQKMFAQMRTEREEMKQYANPAQLFLNDYKEGLPLRIVNCIKPTSCGDRGNRYKDFTEGTTFENLIKMAQPVIQGCTDGDIRMSHLKQMSRKMNIENYWEPILISEVDKSMESKAFELIKHWYNANKRENASPKIFCSILERIDLKFYSEKIYEAMEMESEARSTSVVAKARERSRSPHNKNH